MRVDESARLGGIIKISLISNNMKVCCVFSLESPQILVSTHNIPFSKLSQNCSYGIFSKGLKNEFETAVVNEPSVFEPLKFYCN